MKTQEHEIFIQKWYILAVISAILYHNEHQLSSLKFVLELVKSSGMPLPAYSYVVPQQQCIWNVQVCELHPDKKVKAKAVEYNKKS